MYDYQAMMKHQCACAMLISQPGSQSGVGPFAFESCNCPQAYAPPRNEPMPTMHVQFCSTAV